MAKFHTPVTKSLVIRKITSSEMNVSIIKLTCEKKTIYEVFEKNLFQQDDTSEGP